MSAKKKNFIDKIVNEVEKVAKDNIPDYENKKKKIIDTFKETNDESEKEEPKQEEIKDERVDNSKDKKTNKKFCSNCGEELDENDKFCDSCGKEVKKKKTSKKEETEKQDDSKVKTKKCPNCGASIKSFQTSCKYCQSEISNIKASGSLEEFSKGLEKLKAKPMPKFEGKDSLLKKVIGKDFKDEDEREEFESNFLEQKNEEIANYIQNFPIPNSNEDLTEFMILVTSNIDLKKESDDVIQKAWKSKMNQIYEKSKLSINKESDLKIIKELYESKQSEIKNKKIINAFKISAGVIGWFALLGLLANPIMTVIVCFLIAGIMLTIYKQLINKKILSNNMKLKETTAKNLSYLCFAISILIFLISWILSNPFVSIGIMLLIIALVIFIYYILVEKGKINSKLKLTKKVIYIICGVLAGISLILFIINGVKDFDFGSHSNYGENENNNINDNSNENDKNKETIKNYNIDYKTSEDFEKALNDEKKVKEKIVLFSVKKYAPDSAFGYNIQSGEHLNFISEKDIDVEKGYYVLAKITEEPYTFLNSWIIDYEVLEIYKNKPSIEDNEKEDTSINDKKEQEDKDATNNTSKKEETENKEDVVIMIVPVEDYIGTNYKELKTELESYGVTNIVVESVKTTDSKNKNNTIKEFTINGKTYEPFDEFKKDDEFKIVYWKYEEPASEYELAFIRDMSNYDLYYMFDTDTKKVVFFGTNDTYIEKGTYTGKFSSGVKINWSHGEWTEKFVNKSNSSSATLTDGNGLEWEYEKCDVSKAQKVLDSLK